MGEVDVWIMIQTVAEVNSTSTKSTTIWVTRVHTAVSEKILRAGRYEIQQILSSTMTML